MSAMKTALDAALRKSGKFVEVEIAQAELVYFAYSNVLDFVLRKRSVPVVKPKSFVPPGRCAHVTSVFNQASGTSDAVRCDGKAPTGWLCPNHEWQLLAKRPATAYIRDYQAEAVDSVIRTEERALRGALRGSYGLTKKIQWLEGVTMKTPPESIRVPEPIPAWNFIDEQPH